MLIPPVSLNPRPASYLIRAPTDKRLAPIAAWRRRPARKIVTQQICRMAGRELFALHFPIPGKYTQRQEKSMSAEAAQRAPMMPLQELVQRYLALAGKFGISVALSSFSLPSAETERLFSGYDEDYHISRFFHFTEEVGEKFSIDGVPATHVEIDPEIQSIL
jgi:hypothetical protein